MPGKQWAMKLIPAALLAVVLLAGCAGHGVPHHAASPFSPPPRIPDAAATACHAAFQIRTDVADMGSAAAHPSRTLRSIRALIPSWTAGLASPAALSAPQPLRCACQGRGKSLETDIRRAYSWLPRVRQARRRDGGIRARPEEPDQRGARLLR